MRLVNFVALLLLLQLFLLMGVISSFSVAGRGSYEGSATYFFLFFLLLFECPWYIERRDT
jgi:hypothetical protein